MSICVCVFGDRCVYKCMCVSMHVKAGVDVKLPFSLALHLIILKYTLSPEPIAHQFSLASEPETSREITGACWLPASTRKLDPQAQGENLLQRSR